MRILFLFLLASCVTSKSVKTPEISLPDKWINAEPGDVDRNWQAWWRNFNDPLLDQIISLAIKDNQNLQIAKERVVHSRAQAIASSAKLLPLVSGSGSTSRGLPGVISQNKKQTVYQTNFDASYEIDLFGSNAYAARADKASILGAESDLQNVLISLVAEVASSYVNLRYWQENVRILQELAECQKSASLIQANSYKVGAANKAAELASSIEYNTNMANLNNAKNMASSAYLSIITLLGKNPGDMPFLLEEGGGVPLYSIAPLVAAPADVISRRPDVKSAQHEAFSAGYFEQSVRRSVFPKISISGIFGLQNSNFYPQTGIWQANTSLLMPLLNWGAVSSAIKSAKSQNRQAILAYKQSVIEALADVESKIYNNLMCKENHLLQQKSLASQQKVLDLAIAQHRAGIFSQLQMLNSKMAFYNQQLLYLGSNKDDGLSAIALAKALGV